MEPEKTQYVIIVFVIISTILVFSIGLIMLTFNNKKNQFISKSKMDKLKFKSEISKAQIETKDNTLNEMSRELHDNIGQLLSVAKMQVSFLKNRYQNISKEELADLEELIGKSIDEIRLLTRLLRVEDFNKVNLHESIAFELERINRLKNISCSFENLTNFTHFEHEHEVIIFRIFQEAISNIIKHAQTTKIDVFANSNDEYYTLKIRDYGIGISADFEKNGSGITNMTNRAKLINGFISIINEDIGTSLTLKYPILNGKKENNNR